MKRCALLMLILCPPSAFAASSSADGFLYGKDGKVIAKATIVLQDGQGLKVQTVTTDSKGYYVFHNLSAGSYVVLALDHEAVLASSHISLERLKDSHTDLKMAERPIMNVAVSPARSTTGSQNRSNTVTASGVSAYKINAQAIAALPQGEDTKLDSLLLQAPGVAQDSAASGNLHIRGEHANVQYRINGILLPDGVTGFGEMIDSHVINSAILLDGVLPAAYGLHTAAVVDMTAKNGFSNEGTISMMGGSNASFQPSINYGNTIGQNDTFAAFSHLSSDLGIENPTRSVNAIHDHTEQDRAFLYGAYSLTPNERVTLLAANQISTFQIPNTPNQSPSYQINGTASLPSSSLNERQLESNQFMAMAWQGQRDDLTTQITPSIRRSETHFRPDVNGDLTYTGVASDVLKQDLTIGLQSDTDWRLDGTHKLRGGFLIQDDHLNNMTSSYALLTDASGTPLTSGGLNIISSPINANHITDAQSYGFYIQDEYKATDSLTVTYGGRFDQIQTSLSENQFSPRLALSFKYSDDTTLHVGYASYFTPPPLGLLSASDVTAFNNTTNAADVKLNGTVKAERSHYFDAGLTQKVTEHWQVSHDFYYKKAHDLLDEGQFGSALIMTPFNYRTGHIYGYEASLTYTRSALNAYLNFAASRAMGKDVVSSQYNFSASELAYLQHNAVHLDHDQTYTASGGVSYDLTDTTGASIDSQIGSGLRKGFANQQNLPAFATFNAAVTHKINLTPAYETSLRFSVVNMFDTPYELRDGTGIGVGAPQWGARRGFFVALSQKF